MTFRQLRLSLSPDSQLLIAVAVLIALAALSACSQSQQQSSIASLELALATAEAGAQAYRQLPPCGTAVSAPCKNLAIVGNLQALDNTAYATLKTAERSAAAGLSVDLTAATAAITAFQATLSGLPISK